LTIAFAAAALVVGLTPCLAHAHGGGGRLILEPDNVPPGGTVVARGEDLPADAEVTLVLAGVVGRVELDGSTTDGEGHFTRAITVPIDIADGAYEIEAAVGPEFAIAAPLTISGAPVDTGGGEVARDDDDPLLIALPSGWQRSQSGPSMTAQPVASGGSTTASSASLLSMLFGAAVVLIVVAGGAFLARKRPPG
jgi:hypothetical protein